MEILGWAGVFCAGGLTAYCLMLLGRERPPKRPKGPAAIVGIDVLSRELYHRQAVRKVSRGPLYALPSVDVHKECEKERRA